jgi:hypothetical protein
MLLSMLTLGLSSITPPLLFLDELIGDMTFVLKIFVLMTIVSYVVQHLGKGVLALLVIAVMSWFIIFDYFMYFGGIYILYMLALFGGVQLAMDFFIVGPQMLAGGGHGGGGHGEGEGEHMTGMEFKEKQHRMMEMRKRAGF